MSLIELVDAMFEPQNLWDAKTKKTLADYQKQFVGGPYVDIYTVDGGVEMHVDLPGMSKDDINLSVEKDILTFSGERKETQNISNNEYHYSERRFGTFKRRIKLPFSADPSTISAKYDNGILVVNIPQPESTKAGVITIE